MNDSKKLVKLIVGAVVILLAIVGISKLMVVVKANEIVVKQGVFDGKLTVWTQPGIYAQNFGGLTHYSKSQQYWFSSKKDEGKEEDDSIKVRFNDGGHAQISGSLRFDLPMDVEKMKSIHMKYGSMTAIEKELIRTVVNKSVYLTGPLMSSKESYAEKRAYLLQYIEDQMINGVYKTEMEDRQELDPLSGHEKTVTIVKLIKDPSAPGGLARQEASLISDFGVKIYALSLTSIDYDKMVEEQISQQQQATMAVQTAIAHAKQAEQKAITIAKEGEANAAKAKWEQETLKAQAVTQAEQEKAVAVTAAQKQKEVAQLENEAAEFTKQKNIKLGEGEAARARLNMSANGALEQKLATYEKVQKYWADVMGKQQLVPLIQMGGGGGSSGGAVGFMEFMTAKAAHDLALDLRMNSDQGKK